MKNILITFFLFIGLFSVTKAQKTLEGSFDFIKDLKKINIIIDYSEAKIDGKSEESFIISKTLEEDEGEEWRNYWNNKVKKIFMYKFTSAINENKGLMSLGFLAGDFPDALYTATYKLKRVDSDGELYGNIIFTEKSSNKIVAIIKLNGDGGHWGSIENLMGDAFEKAGIKLGRFLNYKITTYTNQENNSKDN